jgi:hypothetical protein
MNSEFELLALMLAPVASILSVYYLVYMIKNVGMRFN